MPRYSTKPKPKQKKGLLPLWLSLSGLVLVLIAVWAIMSNNAQTKANIEVKGDPRLKVEKPSLTTKMSNWELRFAMISA